MAEWHLTLPPSTLKQWSAKMLAALSTSLVLGLVLPTAIFLAADPLFSRPDSRTSLPPGFAIPCWILGQMLVTSVAVYAASFARTTLQGILASFVILAALGGALLLAVNWAHHIAPAPIPWIGLPHVGEVLIWPLAYAALFFALCLIQGFALFNFRRYTLPGPRLIVQFTVILLSVWLVAWCFFSALFPPRWG